MWLFFSPLFKDIILFLVEVVECKVLNCGVIFDIAYLSLILNNPNCSCYAVAEALNLAIAVVDLNLELWLVLELDLELGLGDVVHFLFEVFHAFNM